MKCKGSVVPDSQVDCANFVDEQIVRLPGVQAMVNLGKTAIYQRINEGLFPAPYRLGPNSVGWKKSEVVGWINNLQQAR